DALQLVETPLHIRLQRGQLLGDALLDLARDRMFGGAAPVLLGTCANLRGSLRGFSHDSRGFGTGASHMVFGLGRYVIKIKRRGRAAVGGANNLGHSAGLVCVSMCDRPRCVGPGPVTQAIPTARLPRLRDAEFLRPAV